MNKILTKEEREEWLKVQSMSVAEMFYCKYKNGEIEHKNDLGEISQDQLIAELKSKENQKIPRTHKPA